MRLVIDASVAVKWCVTEADSYQAARLLHSSHELIAPHFLMVEVGNALTTYWRSGYISSGDVDGVLHKLARLLSAVLPDQDLIADALILARQLRHPVYDCLYLALAWKSQGRVVTLDRRFLAAAEAAGWRDWILSLNDVVSPLSP